MPTLCSLTIAWLLATVPHQAAVDGQQPRGGQDQAAPPNESFKLNLPEWNPDPEDLPPELRPLDVVRPLLPDDVAKQVAELEARIAQLEKLGLTAETRGAQDAALEEAIGLAERVLAIRVEHQGNTAELVRWRNVKGEPAEWHELLTARSKVADLRLFLGLDQEARTALASIAGTDAEAERLYGEGKYAEAQAVTERQLAVHRRVLGDEHPNTLSSINNMGVLLRSQGKLAEAEPYYREALEGRRRVLGSEHPQTLSSINSMGFLLENQGVLAEAEPYNREALEGCRRVLGDEHPGTLTSISNMGYLLQAQGKLAEAEPYCREALETRRRVLGDAHPHTLTSISNMGVLLESQGKLAEAEPYCRETMAGFRRVLGHEHPQTLTSISNMGGLLESQGKLAEAEPYCREAMAGFRRVLGHEHPQTLTSISNMGGLLESQGKLAEAEPYCREALETKRRVLGGGHPDTLSSISNMGGLLKRQGRLADAESYHREALEGFRRVLGDEHPNTLTSINNMGVLLRQQGKLAEAEPLLREALKTRRRVLGVEHPDTLISISSMGQLLRAQGRLAEAEPYYREVLEGYRRVLGDEHPNTLTSISDMGFLLHAQGKPADAEPYYRRALETRRRVLGDEHPHTLTSISNTGFLLLAQGKPAEAEPYLREAMETTEHLRLDIAGDASSRAQYVGELGLTWIASVYARTLLGLERAAEALAVLERGRGRAGLDLFAGGRSAAEAALRATADAVALTRYDAALAAEEEARLAVVEAEARLSKAPDQDKSAWTEQVKLARRTLSEKTAAVFHELRGLVPAVDPLTTEQVLAALDSGEALLSYAWTEEGALALLARDGEVHGVTLAEDEDQAAELKQAVGALRERLATRASSGEPLPQPLTEAARKAALPEELRSLLDGATSLTVVADGPLASLPLEVLLSDDALANVPIAYAPSATIALRPRLEGQASAAVASSGDGAMRGVVLGDPVFAGAESRPEPEYPEAGVLLAMVQEGSNAAQAGLKRGDVLLAYGNHELTSAEELGPAIQLPRKSWLRGASATIVR